MMKSSTRLDSAIFQLTPTRTRCDLVISANGKTEKIASGLLDPFLAHLKTAQEQMAKGGYSIILERGHGSDAKWFTKGTIERFVRFVSTPEVLERVYTLESEILQIEEAIAIQSSKEVGLSTVEDHQAKPADRIEGNRSLPDSNEEKAIVLYQPGAHPPEANGSTVQEGNSKVQLKKVLETRKTVLQKEQGMAFARAVAAGFEIDHMAPLMSFAESFGALRLMDACVRFMELWKQKHESGQWVEIEAVEAMCSRPDFASMNASSIVFSNGTSDSNGKAVVDPSADEQPPTDQHLPPTQFSHPMFSPWPMHSPPGGVPVVQGYPMLGIPYYQSYPGNAPFFQPTDPSGEDPRFNAGQRLAQRRHSMDSYTGPETWEVDALKTRSQDDAALDKETSGSRERGRKTSRSGKKQSDMVVIRSINYISSKRQDSSGTETQSVSGSEGDEEHGDSPSTTYMKHKSSQGSSKHKSSSDKEEAVYREEADGGHWQAFQNYLLRDADEAECAVDQGVFGMEKEVRVKRRQCPVENDPLAFDGRDVGDNQEEYMTDMQSVSGKLAHNIRASNDESQVRRTSHAGDGRSSMDGQIDEQYAVRRSRYRTTTTDDCIIHRGQNKSAYTNSSDPLAVNGFECSNNGLDGRPSNNNNDDSYIVSLRSMSLDQAGNEGRNAIDIGSEFPPSGQGAEKMSKTVGSQVKYEPDDLSMMPERGAEKGSIGYDPALDYDLQANAQSSLNKKEQVVTDARQGSKKLDKNRKSKLIPDASEKRKTVGPIRKEKPSKLSPSGEARARAERLRSFKADLQKMKKEKEEAEMKRLEALKLARQKRIAARGGSSPVRTASLQTRKSLPTKLSPNSHKALKFSDSEPGPSSPLQRSIRTVSAGCNDSLKASKSSKLGTGSHSAGNNLSWSVSSLPETKKENGGATTDTKASTAQIRRLSDPKTSSSHRVSSVKLQNTETVSKPKPSNGPESKKISAIVNHDKSRIASLPELKIRTTKAPDTAHGKSAAKEMTGKLNESRSDGSELGKISKKVSHNGDGDDNTIIEKTVVMLESEKPSIATVSTLEENMGVQKGHSNSYKVRENAETMSGYAAICAPVSLHILDGVDRKPVEHQSQGKPSAYEKTTEDTRNTEKLPKLSTNIVAEEAYQAPDARVSSLEYQCKKNSEYGKGPPASLQTETFGVETLKTHVFDSTISKLEKLPEALNKSQTKKSSKGFRRLLKFGKRSHTSGKDSVELDHVSVTGSKAEDSVMNAGSPGEVHTLKNLISQNETPTAGSTPQKTSRHFSLLSPFRRKTSGKKLNS